MVEILENKTKETLPVGCTRELLRTPTWKRRKDQPPAPLTGDTGENSDSEIKKNPRSPWSRKLKQACIKVAHFELHLV
jgi:hypothetical protein